MTAEADAVDTRYSVYSRSGNKAQRLKEVWWNLLELTGKNKNINNPEQARAHLCIIINVFAAENQSAPSQLPGAAMYP